MPTHCAGPENQQDPIRLRNLLTQATERLARQDLRTPDIRSLLEPVERLLSDAYFWRHQSDGLAVFVDSQTFRYYHLPYASGRGGHGQS